MGETVSMLAGAAKFVGGLLIIFGGIWCFLNFRDQNRMTGPALIMTAGGVVYGLADVFAGGAGGL